ncbi:host cell division inhibitor Icd-like protein [Escherichia coli]
MGWNWRDGNFGGSGLQPQEFIWRFYSCKKHHYHFVIAATEDEARSQLPDGPCIFTARFSTNSRNSLSYWNLPFSADVQGVL